MTKIFYQLIFALLTTSTIRSDESSNILLNFCEFGQSFYKDMVFSLIGDFKFIYIEQLKELYGNMENRMSEITRLIFDLRKVNLKDRRRIDHDHNFYGLIESVEGQINKSNSFLDEMGMFVSDGQSADCAKKIVEGKYEKAAQILILIENNALIYSIVTMVYKRYEDKFQHLACEALFGFTAHLNKRGMQLQAAAVYISLFSVLIEHKHYYSGCTLKLAEFGKIGTAKMAESKLYAHQMEILTKRYRYIRTGVPRVVRNIIDGNRKGHWCIYSPVHEALLFTDEHGVFTKYLTRFDRSSKWILEYDVDKLAYKIRNDEKYLQLSSERHGNSYQKEVVTGARPITLWTIIPLSDDEIAFESLSSNERLISGPDSDYFKRNGKRHAFALNDKLAQLPADNIDRWTLKEC